MPKIDIGIIGAGNMGCALAAGLATTAGAPQVVLYDHTAAKRGEAAGRGLDVTDDLSLLARHASVIILAVKPQHVPTLARTLAADPARADALVLSVAAGIRTDALRSWLATTRVVRAMPNTPALIRAGATVLYAPPDVSRADRKQAEDILRAVSAVWWVEDEDLMDAATAVSGSGPAYFFLAIEALAAAGASAGLPPALAGELAVATALGAARMASAGTEPVTVLRRRVTSPNGTTERAIDALMNGGILPTFEAAVAAARARAAELGQELAAL